MSLEHTTGASPALIQGMQAEYVPEFWPGENTSGLRPFGKNLLVRMDVTAKQTSGGIYLVDEMLERMDMASVTGCIYAIGPEAFRQFDDGHPWRGDAPQVGERVYTEKYAGQIARGKDGGLYRIMDYRAIAAGYLTAEDAASAEIGHKGTD